MGLISIGAKKIGLKPTLPGTHINSYLKKNTGKSVRTS